MGFKAGAGLPIAVIDMRFCSCANALLSSRHGKEEGMSTMMQVPSNRKG